MVQDGAVHEEDLHVAALVDHKEAAAPVMGIRDHDGAVNPPGNPLRPTARSGECSLVRDGYTVKVAASALFWLVRSVTAGVGVVLRGVSAGTQPGQKHNPSDHEE